MTCAWNSVESSTWLPVAFNDFQPFTPSTSQHPPLLTVSEYSNHGPRKISGRYGQPRGRPSIANNGFTGNVSTLFNGMRKMSLNSEPLYLGQRPQQPLVDYDSILSDDKVMRQNSNKRDGRWDGSYDDNHAFGMDRLSVRRGEYVHLMEKCHEQLKLTEKLRLKTEIELTTSLPGMGLTSNTVAKPSDSSTREELLISDNKKEHTRIVTIVSAIDYRHSVHLAVYSTLRSWFESINRLQTAYKQQLDGRGAGNQRTLVPGDLISLALKELCLKTQAARTAFWSAYIIFMANEVAHTGGKPSPAPTPVPEQTSVGSSLFTKTGRSLIPITLPGLVAK